MARVGKFDGSQTYTWSNGNLFNGYFLFGLVIPTFDGTAATVWPDMTLENSKMYISLPKGFAKVPCLKGKLDAEFGLFYNEDIVPVETQYVYYIYDSNSRQIAGPSAFFEVNSSTITLPSLVIGVPSQVNAVAPVPD